MTNKPERAPVESLAFMAPDDQREPMYRFLMKFVRAGERVLDVGCGAGAFVAYATSKGVVACGVDSDPMNVDRARREGLDVRLGNALAPLDDPEVTFDVITMIHLIEHFSPDDAQRLVRYWASRLDKDGRIVIMTPNYADWTVASHIFWLDPTHVRPYPAMLLSQLLEAQGLSIAHSSTQRLLRVGPRQALAQRLGTLRFGRQYGRMNLTVMAQRANR